MSVQRASSAVSECFWYCLNSLNPVQLQRFLRIVMDALLTGGTEEEWVELDEEGFQKAVVPFTPPRNVPHIDGPAQVRYDVRIPPCLKDSVCSEAVLMKILEHSSEAKADMAALKVLCKKDTDFFNSTMFHAHRKSTPLHQLVRDSYEGARDIKYKPTRIEVFERDCSIWINCQYEGTIVTMENRTIPFTAECLYNPMDPMKATRSLFIRDPDRFPE